MPVGGPYEATDLLAWLASEKNGRMTGQTICIDGGRCGDVIAKIFLQNEWFYSAIKRAHTSRYLCALSSGRYSLMKSMNARSLGVICLPDGHSSRKVFCSVVYSSRTVTNAPVSRAARTENSDM